MWQLLLLIASNFGQSIFVSWCQLVSCLVFDQVQDRVFLDSMSTHQKPAPSDTALSPRAGQAAASWTITARPQQPVSSSEQASSSCSSGAPSADEPPQRCNVLDSVLSGMRPPPVVLGYAAVTDTYHPARRCRRLKKEKAPVVAASGSHLPSVASPSRPSSADEWVYGRNDLVRGA